MKQTRDSIADVWGPRTPYRDHWPVRVDERTVEQPDRWVPSACLLCSYGCGIAIGVKDGRIVGMRGRESDRVNHGRLGPKGLHGWIANHSGDRLTTPLIRRKGELQPASWDEAMGTLKAAATELMDVPGKIAKAVSTADDERPVNVFLGMAFQGERHLAEAFKQVAQQHMAEPDIHATCRLMASWSREQAEGLKPFIAAYHKDRSKDPDGSVKNLFDGPRSGGLGLLRDLHDLWLAANEVHLDYEAVKQAAKALHDQPLAETCERHLNQTDRQLAWLRARIDQASPQTLVVS